MKYIHIPPVLLILLCQALTASSDDLNPTEPQTLQSLAKAGLSLKQINSILNTELINELKSYDDDVSEVLWKKATELEWSRALSHHSDASTSSQDDENSESGNPALPLILCDVSPDTSGVDRLIQSHNFLLSVGVSETYLNDRDKVRLVYNAADMTCALARISADHAVDVALKEKNFDLKVQPLVSFVKIVQGSVEAMSVQYGEADHVEDEEEEEQGQNEEDDGLQENVERTNDETNSTSPPEEAQEDNETATTTDAPSLTNATTPTKPEGTANATTFLPPRIHVLLCQGAVSDQDINNINVDVAKNEGRDLVELLLQKTANGQSFVTQLILETFSDSDDPIQDAAEAQAKEDGADEHVENEDGDEEDGEDTEPTPTTKPEQNRLEFWSQVFASGLDATNGICPQVLQHIHMEFDAQSLVLSLTLPTLDELDLDLEGPSSATSRADIDIDKALEWCGLSLLVGISLSHKVCLIQVEPRMKISNIESSWLMQGSSSGLSLSGTGMQHEYPLYQVGLNGTGQVVAVSDTGVDMKNCYFADDATELRLNGEINLQHRKVVQYIPFVDDADYKFGHGTHVSGTAVGSVAYGTGMADGVAKGAKLAFFDIGGADASLRTPFPVTRVLETGREAGAKIHSASWGAESNMYGFNAMLFDNYMHLNDDMLIVIAAGNSGQGNAFHTVGEPATGKNIIAVGASHSSGKDLDLLLKDETHIADFSSKGPTADGRTKPDILAPGKFILSAAARPDVPGACDPLERPPANFADQGVVSMAGTSMAAPGVSGIAAIIRQYFMEGWYPDGVKNPQNSYDPSSAAVKAVILNGGQFLEGGVDNGPILDVFPSQPYDNIQNFGRANLADSLYVVGGVTGVQMQLWDRELAFNGGVNVYSVQIGPISEECRATQLSVTLVWTDPPAVIGCRRCLVNDLDLYVEQMGADGSSVQSVFFPNGRNDPDTLNNAERIRVPATVGDNFKIYVRGTNLVIDNQRYALVATGCFARSSRSIHGGGESSTLHQEEGAKPLESSSAPISGARYGFWVGFWTSALLLALEKGIIQ